MIATQTRSSRTMVRTLVSVVGLALLTACATPVTRFYTLETDAGPAIAKNTTSPALRIDVRPVNVPAAVARSQLVVQINPAQVQVLEDDRWSSALPDEIRDAIATRVSRQAGASAANAVGRGEEVPVYQVGVDVQRFESWPGSHVLVDVVWSVSRSAGLETLSCHSVVSEPVSGGYQAIVDGHRHAINAIADQIGEVVREFAGTAADRPFRPSGASSRTGMTTLSCPQFLDGAQTAVEGAAAPRSGV
ncbi:PqiC family protein [Paraburkholderia sp. CNPSo 3272]|uniref:PqiC family protein n=1 Tax=Paraburkholderia sp. CNPSo 3272 TaxID=2940931 RepID=UPI0020B7E748|nr:PqiC family protein [Paraburkholderia sp. CNPSo 3272]MCP3725049.1 PqiC family protein [Paraburkholderia sp. CNPSo 3272]